MGINIGTIPNRIMSTDLLLMCEKNLDSYDTVKVYYKRVLLAESFYNININSLFIFFNRNVLPNEENYEKIYDSKSSRRVEDFKASIVGSVMKAIKKEGVEDRLYNNKSYNNYKKSYDIFDECFNPNNDRVWKI
jgi:hypothetical protein